MEFLTELWLPIVVSAAIVWIASAINWTAMPHRKAEWSDLPDEEAFLSLLKQGGFKPSNYMFPCCKNQHEKGSDTKKPADGPMGFLSIWPQRRSMGACMIGSFVLDVVIGVFVAYIAWLALQPGAEYMKVFQVVGALAFMAHTFATLGGGIWFGMSLKSMAYTVIEGLVYALLTAGAFAWLWPNIANAADALNAMPG